MRNILICCLGESKPHTSKLNSGFVIYISVVYIVCYLTVDLTLPICSPWIRICNYSSMNIFAQKIHTTLDSLGCRVGPDISLVPRVPISFVVAYLTDVFTVRI